MVTPATSRNIGQSIRRLEAHEKVTGRAEYVHHLRLPRMLTGKIFRSAVPHARIKRIDVSAAQALEGVYPFGYSTSVLWTGLS
jgi:CO/xanthine dehydrogenase Mo-binding subunit